MGLDEMQKKSVSDYMEKQLEYGQVEGLHGKAIRRYADRRIREIEMIR
ncbi:MAG: hypothetical protein IJU50_08850 [Lachnospiraceae bacterium]|nr:hypothetical protein [Lachnospiraceae bacterium]